MRRLIKGFRLNRKSMLLNLVLSYLLVLFVSLSVYFLAFNTSKKVLQKEIENNYQSSLNQLKLVVDKRLNDVENLGIEVSINNKLKNIMMRTYPFDGDDSYQVLQIITQLRSWKVTNTFVEGINIYLPNSDLILSEASTYDFDVWYDINYKNINGMEKDKFKEYLKAYHSKEYKPMAKMNASGNKFKFISYIHSLGVNSNKKSNGTLFISIKESVIKDLLNSYDFISKNGNAFIMDYEGNIISANDSFKLPENINYDHFSNEKGIINTKIEGKSYKIVHIKSDVTNWMYCFALPDSVFFQRLNILSSINIISIGTCLLIAVFVIFYFTRKNYTPIDGIMKIFSKLEGYNNVDKNDEYLYIQSVINKIIIERENMYNKIDSNKLELKSNFLVKILKGKIKDEETFISQCREYDVNLLSGSFAVVLIDPMQSEEINYKKDSQNIRTTTVEILQVILKDIFKDLENDKKLGEIVNIDNKSACIVNVNCDNILEIEKELIRIAEETQKNISQQYGIDLFISISSIHPSYKGIATAFKEAVETMEYQSLTGDIEVLSYNSIKNNSDMLIVKDFESNKKLKNFIEAGDFTGAKEVLAEIFKNSFFDRKNGVSLYFMKAKMYGLVNLVIESMYDLTAKYDSNFFENINPEKRFLNCDNLYKLQSEMESILDYAENYVKSREADKIQGLLHKILEYINLNFCDNNLSVSMISEEFGITVPYTSKFFKKKMGIGLLDYIHSVRIKQAKELLKNKDLQIKDIAEMTGYYNAVAFIRVFKKFEGVSPGKYGKVTMGYETEEE